MKTAISLPDALFESAEALAHRLGVSRSEGDGDRGDGRIQREPNPYRRRRTLEKGFLAEHCGRLRPRSMAAIADDMRLVLDL